jgi:signal transduction histidine kinase
MTPDDEPARSRPSVRAALSLALAAKPREELELERGLLTGIAAFRWAAWGWGAIVWVLNVAQDQQSDVWERGPVVAGTAVLAAALAWTAVASIFVRRSPGVLLDRWALAVELAVAGTMVFVDMYAYGSAQHAQSLGTVWPLAVVLTAGVAYGGWGGLAAGLVLGLVRLAGEIVFVRDVEYRGDHLLAASGSSVLYGLGGAVAGYLTLQLRLAERRIAVARARDEVARTLHDGVLQTLAIVERRSTDADLVALAREQEHELREFLFSTRPDPHRRPGALDDAGPAAGGPDLGARLRAVSAEAERRYGLRSDVVLADPDVGVPDAVAGAVAGAVSEALTNAAKHGGAGRATIYVEPDDDGGGIFCSVKDDGRGFDPGATAEGIGISRSIRGRLADVGGSATIESRPGRGAEVVLRVPGG